MNQTRRKYFLAAIVATLAMVLYAQFVFGHFSKCFIVDEGPNALGLSITYTLADVLEFLRARSTQQLECYISFIGIWDMIFPLLYTLMHLLWIKALFLRARFLYLIPLCHMIMDFGENYFEIALVEQYLNYGTIAEQSVTIASTFTLIKWIFSIGTYLIILIGIFKLLKHWRKSKSTPK